MNFLVQLFFLTMFICNLFWMIENPTNSVHHGTSGRKVPLYSTTPTMPDVFPLIETPLIKTRPLSITLAVNAPGNQI